MSRILYMNIPQNFLSFFSERDIMRSKWQRSSYMSRVLFVYNRSIDFCFIFFCHSRTVSFSIVIYIYIYIGSKLLLIQVSTQTIPYEVCTSLGSNFYNLLAVVVTVILFETTWIQKKLMGRANIKCLKLITFVIIFLLVIRSLNEHFHEILQHCVL